MSNLIFDRWKEFLLSEGRTSQYGGSPLEDNGSSVETNKSNRRKKQKKSSMHGLSTEDVFVSPHEVSEEKKKSNCKPGNPVHKKADGKFGKKDDAGSWSIDYGGSGSEPCSRGVLRKPGASQHKVWTKADDCGRRGKWKCGTKGEKRAPWTSEGVDAQESFDGYVMNLLIEKIEQYEEFMSQDEGLIDETGSDLAAVCRKKLNLLSFNDFLLAQQKLVASSKGDLFKQKKD